MAVVTKIGERTYDVSTNTAVGCLKAIDICSKECTIAVLIQKDYDEKRRQRS